MALPAEFINLSLAYANAGQVRVVALRLPAGSTVTAALVAARIELLAGSSVALWGKAKPVTELLREGDRIEVCAALRCDPKEARRLRYAQKKAALKKTN
jgi:uncharacterized protein